MVGFADARTHQRLVVRSSHGPDIHPGDKRQGKKRMKPPNQKLSILWYIPLIIIITSVGVLLFLVNNLLILVIDNSSRLLYMQGLQSFLFVCIKKKGIRVPFSINHSGGPTNRVTNFSLSAFDKGAWLPIKAWKEGKFPTVILSFRFDNHE
jgi:hypothetical protein